MKSNGYQLLKIFITFISINLSLIFIGVLFDKFILEHKAGDTSLLSTDKGGSIVIMVLSIIITYLITKLFPFKKN